MEALDFEQADKLVLLGDLLYHGPRNDLPKGYNPKKVIEMLNEKKDMILCVKGNCDSEVDQMVLDFSILSDNAILCDHNQVIYVAHGHKEKPSLHHHDIFLQGHTHIPKCEEDNGILYLNPGSTSLPKEGSAHSYMVWENGTFTWKDIETKEVIRCFSW